MNRVPFLCILTLIAVCLSVPAAASPTVSVSPLAISLTPGRVDVGDVVTISLSASREDMQANVANREVTLTYRTDPDEGTTESNILRETLTLDGTGRAVVDWVIPESLPDRYVTIDATALDGEFLGLGHLVVGNPPERPTVSGGTLTFEMNNDGSTTTGPLDTADESTQPAPSGIGSRPIAAGIGLVAAVVGVAVFITRRT